MITEKKSSKFATCHSCCSTKDVKDLEIGSEDSIKSIITLCGKCRSNLVQLLNAEEVCSECRE
jgi:uncharacterized CHY-type Zn-finger protein